MSAPLIRAQGLVAGWQRPATAPLDFMLEAGRILGLTGANGVGKTTVLSALAGSARVFSGALEMRPGLRLALQTQGVPPVDGVPLSGRELLALTAASPDGLPPWLVGRLDHRLDRLSGGQRHYLTLWTILQAPADLVLLDEPTNNLDAAGVAHLATVLRKRAESGCGVVLVSHDHDFVDQVCDQVMVLQEVADVV
ncbi:ATP-binding cassette domain-containing protein [Dechloromonas sp. H13]|uniref:ATP-binding cassette domain-containing protein n=1 Tax=Dechloromonas sp. H13 TaxID=2570193 RepID=UPI001D194E9D|nr:ATP-binding cassette domain-containing protein [Dechloromonas sp. H13]